MMLNKRIFELIQAQNGFRGLLWTEEDKQEFAELIVQECIQLMDNEYSKAWNNGVDASSDKFVNGINKSMKVVKEHFGVKE